MLFINFYCTVTNKLKIHQLWCFGTYVFMNFEDYIFRKLVTFKKTLWRFIEGEDKLKSHISIVKAYKNG